MSEQYQDHYDRKIFLVAIAASILGGSLVIVSEFVQLSIAPLEQLEQLENVTGITGNQSGGGVLEQLGEQARNVLPGL